MSQFQQCGSQNTPAPDRILQGKGKSYQIGKAIGEGGEAEVFEGIVVGTNKKVAIKKYKQSIQDREKNLLKVLEQKQKQIYHLTLIEELLYNQGNVSCVVMELAHDNLSKYMENDEFKKKSVIEKNLLFLQIVRGVQELHSLQNFHRDLKPSNVVIFRAIVNSQQLTLKLCDYGMVKPVDCFTTHSNSGTLYYKPKEQYSFSYDMSVDIWALGVIWFEMFYNEVYKKIYRMTQQEINSLIDGISQQNMKTILQNILIIEPPSNRWQISRIQEELENITKQLFYFNDPPPQPRLQQSFPQYQPKPQQQVTMQPLRVGDRPQISGNQNFNRPFSGQFQQQLFQSQQSNQTFIPIKTQQNFHQTTEISHRQPQFMVTLQQNPQWNTPGRRSCDFNQPEQNNLSIVKEIEETQNIDQVQQGQQQEIQQGKKISTIQDSDLKQEEVQQGGFLTDEQQQQFQNEVEELPIHQEELLLKKEEEDKKKEENERLLELESQNNLRKQEEEKQEMLRQQLEEEEKKKKQEVLNTLQSVREECLINLRDWLDSLKTKLQKTKKSFSENEELQQFEYLITNAQQETQHFIKQVKDDEQELQTLSLQSLLDYEQKYRQYNETFGLTKKVTKEQIGASKQKIKSRKLEDFLKLQETITTQQYALAQSFEQLLQENQQQRQVAALYQQYDHQFFDEVEKFQMKIEEYQKQKTSLKIIYSEEGLLDMKKEVQKQEQCLKQVTLELQQLNEMKSKIEERIQSEKETIIQECIENIKIIEEDQTNTSFLGKQIERSSDAIKESAIKLRNQLVSLSGIKLQLIERTKQKSSTQEKISDLQDIKALVEEVKAQVDQFRVLKSQIDNLIEDERTLQLINAQKEALITKLEMEKNQIIDKQRILMQQLEQYPTLNNYIEELKKQRKNIEQQSESLKQECQSVDNQKSFEECESKVLILTDQLQEYIQGMQFAIEQEIERQKQQIEIEDLIKQAKSKYDLLFEGFLNIDQQQQQFQDFKVFSLLFQRYNSTLNNVKQQKEELEKMYQQGMQNQRELDQMKQDIKIQNSITMQEYLSQLENKYEGSLLFLQEQLDFINGYNTEFELFNTDEKTIVEYQKFGDRYQRKNNQLNQMGENLKQLATMENLHELKEKAYSFIQQIEREEKFIENQSEMWKILFETQIKYGNNFIILKCVAILIKLYHYTRYAKRLQNQRNTLSQINRGSYQVEYINELISQGSKQANKQANKYIQILQNQLSHSSLNHQILEELIAEDTKVEVVIQEQLNKIKLQNKIKFRAVIKNQLFIQDLVEQIPNLEFNYITFMQQMRNHTELSNDYQQLSLNLY